MTDQVYRHVPYNIEIEQALLGSILVDNRLLDRAEILEPKHFYDPLHARIYQGTHAMIAGGEATPLTLHAAMKADPGLIEVGGMAYFFGLASAAPAMPNIKDYVRILIDLWGRRQLIELGERIVNGAYETPDETPTHGLTDEAVRDLLALGSSYRADRTQPLVAVMKARLKAAERRLAGEAIPTITTGLWRLNRALGGGLQPGDHMVLAGRSGAGKSALALCMGRAAAQAGHPVLVICADMTRERWGDRTNTDLDHLMRHGADPLHYGRFRGKMAGEHIARLYEALLPAEQWAYDICDEGEITTARMRAKVRAMANRYPGQQGLLITDFVQKIKRAERRKDERRDEEITATTYEIGDIVKDTGWAALTLAQLKNKDTDAKGQVNDKEPNETDIRESGGIQQAADIVAAIHRKAYFLERKEPPGRDYAEGPPPEWHEWNAKLQEVINDAQIVGFKNRDDAVSKLHMTLWCDMGSNAFRDKRPSPAAEMVAQQELLDSIR